MSTIRIPLATAAAAALLFCGSALAASAFAAPAAGNAPYFDGPTVTSSQVQRADVEAQAEANPPAAGEFSAHAVRSRATSDLTRAEVESRIDAMPLAGESA